MRELHQFGKFALREVDEWDRAQIDAWIIADPWHRGKMTSNFFLGLHEDGTKDPRATCYVIDDGDGDVFFVRLSRASRVNIQFSPDSSRQQKERNREALQAGMALLEVLLGMAGAEEWIFNSSNPDLRITALRRMGFTASPQELVRAIPQAHASNGNDAAVLPEQIISQEVA